MEAAAAQFALMDNGMKTTSLCAALALGCCMNVASAYTVKTYHGAGTSRVEACSLAKAGAQSPKEESAHGKMTKVSACQCTHADGAMNGQWQCQVQTVHER
jgi:hypothetical protein